MKTIVTTSQAPKAIGPYSQGVATGGLVYCSGQVALDPATGRLAEGDIALQTEQALRNLAAVLNAAGSSLARVVKTTVYLKDLGDFKAMNEVYGLFFTSEPPARTTIQAARLPLDALVEIDAIAVAG